MSKNHKYYNNIIDLCNFVKINDYNINNLYNIINLLIKSADRILDKNLKYIDDLHKCYNNLLEIKNKCIIIIKFLILSNIHLNDKIIYEQVNIINDYLKNLNSCINEIYEKYNNFNTKNEKLLQILCEINNLKDNIKNIDLKDNIKDNIKDIDLKDNINIYLKYNYMLNLLYIPNIIILNMFKNISQKYNDLLILYIQNKELIYNYQLELYDKHIINQLIFNKECLQIKLQLCKFI